LTIVLGSSGSGKTTFLEDVYKLNDCCYVRQYHMVRPYIPVCKVPSFDCTKLPYWSLYNDKTIQGKKNLSYNPNVHIGGTMAGEFLPGLSGGQRKMMLFELVVQRTAGSSLLLILFDEPFAGVTDDFVPFIVERLGVLRQKHNVLLVTNDHVTTLTEEADCTIIVSATDRSRIQVKGEFFQRVTALHAVSSGTSFASSMSKDELWFFVETEIVSSPHLKGVFGFMVFTMILSILTFWDSDPSSASLLFVAFGLVVFFAIQPYLISLPDWRNCIGEESQALMHSSEWRYKVLKALLTSVVVVIINCISFGVMHLCLEMPCSKSPDGFAVCGFKLWLIYVLDFWSLLVSFLFLGIFSRQPLQIVQVAGSMPFLLMLFFSTTMSPGSGVVGVKFLRYVYPRYYVWCALPFVKQAMDGCPSDDTIVGYVALTGNLFLIFFLAMQAWRTVVNTRRKQSHASERIHVAQTQEYKTLQNLILNSTRG